MSNKVRVIISVHGGVVDPWQIPEGVEVEVRDYDNGECAPEDDPSLRVDDMGDRYCEAMFWQGD